PRAWPAGVVVLPRLLRAVPVFSAAGLRWRHRLSLGGLAAAGHSPCQLRCRIDSGRHRRPTATSLARHYHSGPRDTGFAIPEVYEFCEREGLLYALGFASNEVLRNAAECGCSTWRNCDSSAVCS